MMLPVEIREEIAQFIDVEQSAKNTSSSLAHRDLNTRELVLIFCPSDKAIYLRNNYTPRQSGYNLLQNPIHLMLSNLMASCSIYGCIAMCNFIPTPLVYREHKAIQLVCFFLKIVIRLQISRRQSCKFTLFFARAYQSVSTSCSPLAVIVPKSNSRQR